MTLKTAFSTGRRSIFKKKFFFVLPTHVGSKFWLCKKVLYRIRKVFKKQKKMFTIFQNKHDRWLFCVSVSKRNWSSCQLSTNITVVWNGQYLLSFIQFNLGMKPKTLPCIATEITMPEFFWHFVNEKGNAKTSLQEFFVGCFSFCIASVKNLLQECNVSDSNKEIISTMIRNHKNTKNLLRK